MVLWKVTAAIPSPYGEGSRGARSGQKPEIGLREVARILKPDGRIVITGWCKDYLGWRVLDSEICLSNDPVPQPTSNSSSVSLNANRRTVSRTEASTYRDQRDGRTASYLAFTVGLAPFQKKILVTRGHDTPVQAFTLRTGTAYGRCDLVCDASITAPVRMSEE